MFDVRHGVGRDRRGGRGAAAAPGSRVRSTSDRARGCWAASSGARCSGPSAGCAARSRPPCSWATRNKAHDGFVGHSVVGHWVNLGAGTTTSNLKNTYGAVRLEVAGTRIETGRSNLGTLFGDHAKTAIGTMLATGTVVGAGANVFGAATPPKYVPPFAWGCAGERVTEDGFLRVAERVMARRDVAWPDARQRVAPADLRAERRADDDALRARLGLAGELLRRRVRRGRVLIDAGFSAREIERRAASTGPGAGASVGGIVAHPRARRPCARCGAAGSAARRAGAHRAGYLERGWAAHAAMPSTAPLGLCAQSRSSGPFSVTACPTSHDAAEPLAVAVRTRGRQPSVGVAYDLGRPTAAVRYLLRDLTRDRARGEPRRGAAPHQRLPAVGAASDRGLGRPSLQPRGGRAAGRAAPSRTRRSWCWRT